MIGFVGLSRLYVELALIPLIYAGKPHNFVCSECRLPENLIGCGTCCRAYHPQCLSAAKTASNLFHCPSCKENAWDRVSPSLQVSSAPTNSRGATPGSSFQRTEPPSRETPGIQGSPLTGYDTPRIAAANFSLGEEMILKLSTQTISRSVQTETCSLVDPLCVTNV